MSNLLRRFFSTFTGKQQAHKIGTENDSRYIASPLRRHRISLTATASLGFSGIPEEIRIRDINDKGLYFYTKLDMPIGESLDIAVVLPPDISADGKGRRVHYEAKVVRVEPELGKRQYGVGAAIRRCETFPLPTTIRPKKSAIAPDRGPAPAPKSIQPTNIVQEKLQPAPKTHAPLRIPKIAEPMTIPKTMAKVEGPLPVLKAPAPVAVQNPTARVLKIAAPAEKAIAPVVEINAPAVIDDPATSDRKTMLQNRRAIIEKLAAAALRAGISLEELIRLVDAGITPTELVDIIEARLTVRIE